MELTDENCKNCMELVEKCRAESSKRVIGQREVVDGILMAVVAGGHVLLEGVPGLAKTLAVKTFAQISGLDFKRIQFTPDLLPADISGTLFYEQTSGRFLARKGPIFTNVVLADEVNRSPAKVQSALLEAMAEKQVTIGDETFSLPFPFLVLATQNPIEQEGTYPLPEAELDRFLLKILVSYPTFDEEIQIVKSAGNAELFEVDAILDAQKIKEMQDLAQKIVCDEKILKYIVSIVEATRPTAEKNAPRRGDISRYVLFGASPRAGIALLKCARVNALFCGRQFVLPDDVKKVAPAVLRHRLVLSYEAAADNMTADSLVQKILSLVPIP